jgi:AraC-like DNA-binding protein
VRPPLTQLILLHRDRLLRERLLRATPDTHRLRPVGSWAELSRALDRAPATALAVVDPYHGVPGRTAPSPELYALLRDLPSATVVAAVEMTVPEWEHLRWLGAWGVAQIIALDEEVTVPALRERLRALRGRLLHATLQRHLPHSLDGRARTVILHAAEVASNGGGAEQLCASLHVSLRTLLRWCVAAELPAPRRLLAWMRLVLASALLDDPGRTVLGVALACGYYSDNTLRRAFRDFLGTSPTRMRKGGALPLAMRSFLTEIHRLPEPDTPPPAAQGPESGSTQRLVVR